MANMPPTSVPNTAVLEVARLLGLPDFGVTRIEIDPHAIRVTMHRFNDAGEMYIARENETAKVTYDIAIDYPSSDDAAADGAA